MNGQNYQNNANIAQHNMNNAPIFAKNANNTIQYSQNQQLHCPRCGSFAVFTQVMQEQQGTKAVTKTKSKYKQKKHGLLWWIFIGSWWWIIDIFLWLFAFPLRFAFALFRKKKYVKTETSVTSSKNKIVYRKVCTCQQCGNVWTETV